MSPFAVNRFRLISAFCVTAVLLATFAVVQIAFGDIDSEVSPTPCCNQAGYGFPRCVQYHRHIVPLYNSVGFPDTRKGGRQDAVLDLDLKLVNYPPEFSVVISLHNHASIVAETIGSLLNRTRGLWEAVLVFDDCQDDTLIATHAVVKTWLNSEDFRAVHCSTGLLTRVRFLLQPTSVWETSSDNLGLRISSPSHYYLLVQADMTGFEEGFNLKMAAPFDVYPDLFAVSARCSHNLLERLDSKPRAGRCGGDIDAPLTVQDIERNRNIVFVRDTVNRGPLMVRADRLRAVGFFDEVNFFQGDDDHNLMLRAYTQYGWKSGHFQIDFKSPMEYGTTRTSAFTPPSEQHLQYLQGRKDQVNLSHHHHMLQMIGERPHWNEDRHLMQSQIDSVIQQSHSRLSYIHQCQTELLAQ